MVAPDTVHTAEISHSFKLALRVVDTANSFVYVTAWERCKSSFVKVFGKNYSSCKYLL